MKILFTKKVLNIRKYNQNYLHIGMNILCRMSSGIGFFFIAKMKEKEKEREITNKQQQE